MNKTIYECVNEKTRQEVIQLKLPILLKLGTNVGFGDWMIVSKN